MKSAALMSSILARFRRSRVLLIGLLLVALVDTTAAIVAAEVTTSNGPFTGCLSKYGIVYNAKAGAAPLAGCVRGDTQIAFGNGQGAQGIPGRQGIPGTNGAPGVGDLGCNDGQTIRWNATAAAWVCADVATPPPPTWSTIITFDSAAVTYTLTGFGGAEDSTVVVDPVGGTNMVARVVKSATAELWAGTTVSTGADFSVPTLPFTAVFTKMAVRVYSPDAGIQVRLKVEDAADPTKSVETDATTTLAGGWETLTFDFANQAAGTAALNLAYTYNKVSIYFNFGVTGATAGEKTYYFDDMAFGG
jgi:hypothetical protein